MRRITIKGARVIACGVLSALIIGFTALSVFNAKAVSLTSGKSYAPYYHGDRSKAQVALMINVYENADVVNAMLDMLVERGAKATFFVGGCWADDNAETVRRIVETGMEIGNHGYFHKDHKKLSAEANEREISTNHALVKSLTGVEMDLFAPPSGSFSETTLQIAEKLGYKSIMWSKDTIDWRDEDEDLIFRRATEGLENGDMILMHPKKHTLAVLGRILDHYKEKNVETVTVSQIIAADGKNI